MSSRTDSVVRGGSWGEPVKILAPVSGHTVRLRQAAAGGVSVTFERKYAERLTLARRAAARSCRASGSSTLKVMVVMGNTVIPSPGPSRPFVYYRHYRCDPHGIPLHRSYGGATWENASVQSRNTRRHRYPLMQSPLTYMALSSGHTGKVLWVLPPSRRPMARPSPLFLGERGLARGKTHRTCLFSGGYLHPYSVGGIGGLGAFGADGRGVPMAVAAGNSQRRPGLSGWSPNHCLSE